MDIKISKHFKGGKHVGYKKSVGGRNFHLVYGVGADHERAAKAIARALETRWRIVRLEGRTEWAKAEVDECFAQGRIALCGNTIAAANTPAAAQTSARPMLYATIDRYKEWLLGRVGPDGRGDENAASHRERIEKAKEGLSDTPLDDLRRLQLDGWLAYFRKRPTSKATGKPIGAVRVRNIVSTIRHFFNQCVEWELWNPPPNWAKAFKSYSLKALSTEQEKCEAKKPFECHTLQEKQLLWHFCLPFMRAMMGLADWAGHTQKEISTLVFDHIVDDGSDMYIDRTRHKTGVQGRWWVPPEVAVHVRTALAKTPRDRKTNPYQLAFLTPRGLPLVHRNFEKKGQRSDLVGDLWETALRTAASYGVRWISYKHMRKGTAQAVRDALGKDYAKLFCAHQMDDVQDEHYSRPDPGKLEQFIRTLYEERRSYFQKPDWDAIPRNTLANASA